MNITICLWGQLKQTAGTDTVLLHFDEPVSIETILKKAAADHPALFPLIVDDAGAIRQSNLAFIEGELQPFSAMLDSSAELILMSPVAGG